MFPVLRRPKRIPILDDMFAYFIAIAWRGTLRNAFISERALTELVPLTIRGE
jgi:hypothetical protein